MDLRNQKHQANHSAILRIKQDKEILMAFSRDFIGMKAMYHLEALLALKAKAVLIPANTALPLDCKQPNLRVVNSIFRPIKKRTQRDLLLINTLVLEDQK